MEEGTDTSSHGTSPIKLTSYATRKRTLTTPETPRRPTKLRSIKRRGCSVQQWGGTTTSGASCESQPDSQLTYSPVSSPLASKSWSDFEITALIEGVVKYNGNKWISDKNWKQWNAIALHVKTRANTRFQRTGQACRYKVVAWLRRRYSTPKHAASLFGREVPASSVSLMEERTRTKQPPSTAIAQQVVSSVKEPPAVMLADSPHQERLDPITAELQFPLSQGQEPCSDHLKVIADEFNMYCRDTYDLYVPADFLCLCIKAMLNLKRNGRANVLYNLAKGFGTLRADESDTRLPIKRMPMGLIEHVTNFFVVDNNNQVPRCPPDYRSWQVTMYSQFGQKWAKLHHGPLWSVAHAGAVSTRNNQDKDPMQAMVNIPAISEATLRREIASTNITLDSRIQTSVLDEAKSVHPNIWWWIKADACDLVAGLGTSVDDKWSGDVNIRIEELDTQYEAYCKRIQYIHDIGTTDVADELKRIQSDITTDTTFIDSSLRDTNSAYQKQLAREQTSTASKEKHNFDLAWDIKELGELNNMGHQLLVDCSVLLDKLDDVTYDRQADNFPRKLNTWKETAVSFVKRVIKYRRTAATHVLVVLISPEERCKKPYALAVQCIAYRNLKDKDARGICNKLVKEMNVRGMKVAGFTTNGEFNSLRSKGNGRPLSIFELRSNARNKVSKWSQKTMLKMLSPTIQMDGSVKAEMHNPAVNESLLIEIHDWVKQGQSRDYIIATIRERLVPQGYTYHTWRQGISESQTEKLKSILAQLEFQFQVGLWEAKGVHFKTHMHVPENHPLTGDLFCEREDEGHVFKRIGNSLRQGRATSIKLERFVEALKDPSSGLTYPALTGVRKQSVQDVERLFGLGVLQFMEAHGYTKEAEYIRSIRNWRRAVDERGLPEERREQYGTQLLDFMAKDLIPWYDSGHKDFSTLEVNRSVDNVNGMTRETLIALAADIETRNYRRKFLLDHRLKPEHPRSSTTDDVECFFSVLRDMVGKDFTLKQVYYGWRKVCLEFTKRLDPELPFFYYTSSHSRFYEGEMPSFNEAAPKKRQTRLPQRELIGAIGRQVSVPVRGSLSVRAKFHSAPIELPPLPNPTDITTILEEHSY